MNPIPSMTSARRTGGHRPLLRLALAAALAALLSLTSGSPATGSIQRVKIGNVELPGIDLGYDARPMPEALGGRVRGGAPAARGKWLPGRVLVKYKTNPDFEIVTIDQHQDAEAVAERLAGLEGVEYAQADYLAHPHFRPNDPLFDQQWNMSAIGMERAWDINSGATSSIIVAVLDTGVAYDTVIYEYFAQGVIIGSRRYPPLGRVSVPFAAAPDLAGPNRFAAPRDFIWNDTAPVDLDGHGTHVAGTIGQLTNNGVGVAGMAFNVRIMPVKVLDGDWDLIFDAPNVGTVALIASAIRYAADNGARVINMSLGFSPGVMVPAIEDALRYAVGRGVFVAISAGNDFEEGNPVEPLAELAARIDGVMAVGAVDRQLNRAPYSSQRPAVEIAAPGGDTRTGPSGGILQQTYDPLIGVSDPLSQPVSSYGPPRFDVFRYVPFQGTSMAAPHVAGLAALLMQQGLTDPVAIEMAIRRFATDRGAPGRDEDFGYGLINPRDTLRGLGLSR
jgi:serine protease